MNGRELDWIALVVFGAVVFLLAIGAGAAWIGWRYMGLPWWWWVLPAGIGYLSQVLFGRAR